MSPDLLGRIALGRECALHQADLWCAQSKAQLVCHVDERRTNEFPKISISQWPGWSCVGRGTTKLWGPHPHAYLPLAATSSAFSHDLEEKTNFLAKSTWVVWQVLAKEVI